MCAEQRYSPPYITNSRFRSVKIKSNFEASAAPPMHVCIFTQRKACFNLAPVAARNDADLGLHLLLGIVEAQGVRETHLLFQLSTLGINLKRVRAEQRR
jgi:hypothetical protein